MHEVERGMHLARHGVRTGLAWEVVGIAHRAMGGGKYFSSLHIPAVIKSRCVK